MTKNMRLNTTKIDKTCNEIKTFVDQILKLGDGVMDCNEKGEGQIDIPAKFLITESEKSLLSLFDFVYPNILQ